MIFVKYILLLFGLLSFVAAAPGAGKEAPGAGKEAQDPVGPVIVDSSRWSKSTKESPVGSPVDAPGHVPVMGYNTLPYQQGAQHNAFVYPPVVGHNTLPYQQGAQHNAFVPNGLPYQDYQSGPPVYVPAMGHNVLPPQPANVHGAHGGYSTPQTFTSPNAYINRSQRKFIPGALYVMNTDERKPDAAITLVIYLSPADDNKIRVLELLPAEGLRRDIRRSPFATTYFGTGTSFSYIWHRHIRWVALDKFRVDLTNIQVVDKQRIRDDKELEMKNEDAQKFREDLRGSGHDMSNIDISAATPPMHRAHGGHSTPQTFPSPNAYVNRLQRKFKPGALYAMDAAGVSSQSKQEQYRYQNPVRKPDNAIIFVIYLGPAAGDNNKIRALQLIPPDGRRRDIRRGRPLAAKYFEIGASFGYIWNHNVHHETLGGYLTDFTNIKEIDKQKIRDDKEVEMKGGGLRMLENDLAEYGHDMSNIKLTRRRHI